MKQSLVVFLCLLGVAACDQFLFFDAAQPLAEYGAIMPPEAYQKLLEIYNKRDLIAIDKFKELDDLFMTLPDDVLVKMPLPKVFRKLPQEIQQKIHDVYYNKSLPFENKLEELDHIISTLPEELLNLLPHQPEFPEVGDLIEFQVSVLLQFNGFFTTESLRNYLTPEAYDRLLIIAREKDVPEATRAYLIGRLMKEAYTENADAFPLPVGEDDNGTMPEAIKKAGLHLMFSKNPFEKTEPFDKLIADFQKLTDQSKNNTISTTIEPTTEYPEVTPQRMRGLGKKLKKSFKKGTKAFGKATEKLGKRKLMDAIKGNKNWKTIETFVDGLALKVMM